VLNRIWVALVLVGFSAALVQTLQGDLDIFSRVLTGLFDSAKTGFDISIGLVGVMSLWLGIMKVGERGGIIQLFGRALGPFFRRVFPDIPAGHPASGSIVMNVSANMLGLDNAATPLGLKAMRELQEINPAEGHGEQPDDHVPRAQHSGHHADSDRGDRHPRQPRRQAGPGRLQRGRHLPANAARHVHLLHHRPHRRRPLAAHRPLLPPGARLLRRLLRPHGGALRLAQRHAPRTR
jgi:hypothetical protein